MRTNSFRPFIAFLIFLLSTGFIFLGHSAHAISLSKGNAAPGFTLRSVTGETVSLDAFKGSIAIIIYVNIDQKRSKATLKDIKDIYSNYKQKGVRVIGITGGTEDRNAINSIIKEYGIEFPLLLDSERAVYSDYGIRVYPSTIIIDREGNVADSIPGHALSYKIKIEGTLRYMLGEIDMKDLQNILSPVQEHRDEAELKAERRYNLALKFIEMKLFDQAMNAARLALDAKPEMVSARILLGFLNLADHNTDEALQNFEAALSADPEATDAKTGLGGALIAKGEPDRAIEILSGEANPVAAPIIAQYYLGRAYELEGQPNRSMKIYKDVLQRIAGRHIIPVSMARCE